VTQHANTPTVLTAGFILFHADGPDDIFFPRTWELMVVKRDGSFGLIRTLKENCKMKSRI